MKNKFLKILSVFAVASTMTFVACGEKSDSAAGDSSAADSGSVAAVSVEKGKEVFMGKGACFTCHGEQGKGDGPQAATLAVKPRSFDAPVGEWKNGPTMEGIMKTLNEGIPPKYVMTPYKQQLSEDERKSVAKYVLKLAGK